jgi:glutaredoxin
MSDVALVLYGRAGCHLCEEMRAVVEPVVQQLGCVLQEVDITGHAELEGRFGLEIPVLCINGRKAFKYRVTEPELRERLGRATRRRV